MSTNFDQALAVTLRFEGGYVNDPDDTGGETNFGVTQRVYDSHRKAAGLEPRTVKDIERAEVAAVYKHGYWNAVKCDDLPWPLSLCVFDLAVNAGTSASARMLQRVLKLTDDGVIGPKTIAAAQAGNAAQLSHALLDARQEFYKKIVANRPRNQKFFAGWMKRVARLRGLVDQHV
mgnify:CR=1 FL=1